MISPADFGLGAIAGYLARVLLEHVLSKSRASGTRRIERFNAAAMALRGAFADAVAYLRSVTPGKDGDAYEQLKAAFPQHEKAVFTFVDNLPEAKREPFLEAWKHYYFPTGAKVMLPEEIPTYMLAQYIGVNDEEEAEKRKLALKRIEVILGFAVPQ